MVKYCPKCGEKHPDEINFCKKCGYNFNPEENQRMSGIGYTPVIVIGYVLSFFLPLISIIISIFLITRSKKTVKLHGIFIILLTLIVIAVRGVLSYGYI